MNVFQNDCNNCYQQAGGGGGGTPPDPSQIILCNGSPFNTNIRLVDCQTHANAITNSVVNYSGGVLSQGGVTIVTGTLLTDAFGNPLGYVMPL